MRAGIRAPFNAGSPTEGRGAHSGVSRSKACHAIAATATLCMLLALAAPVGAQDEINVSLDPTPAEELKPASNAPLFEIPPEWADMPLVDTTKPGWLAAPEADPGEGVVAEIAQLTQLRRGQNPYPSERSVRREERKYRRIQARFERKHRGHSHQAHASIRNGIANCGARLYPTDRLEGGYLIQDGWALCDYRASGGAADLLGIKLCMDKWDGSIRDWKRLGCRDDYNTLAGAYYLLADSYGRPCETGKIYRGYAMWTAIHGNVVSLPKYAKRVRCPE